MKFARTAAWSRNLVLSVLALAILIVVAGCGGGGAEAGQVGNSSSGGSAAGSEISGAQGEEMFGEATKALFDAGYLPEPSDQFSQWEGALHGAWTEERPTGFTYAVVLFNSEENAAAFITKSEASITDRGENLNGRPSRQIGNFVVLGSNSKKTESASGPDSTAEAELEQIAQIVTKSQSQ